MLFFEFFDQHESLAFHLKEFEAFFAVGALDDIARLFIVVQGKIRFTDRTFQFNRHRVSLRA